MRRGWALLVSVAAPVSAQPAPVVSAGPETVSVSIYRDRSRSAGAGMRLEYLQGYALISETRTIAVPAGDGEIRFEGVAGGILPESAIVTGLPDGVVEKNQDADLLSPAALLDRWQGRRVTLRRTSRATGEVRTTQAVLRSGPAGAVVLQTAEGFEALRCSGLNETLVYDGVPPGLSARPTLSVRTRARAAGRATVTLSYLADRFDWQANYVAELDADERRMRLFAWVTLASGDETSFVDASTQAIAGKPNRVERQGRAPEPPRPFVNLLCWPAGTTSDVPTIETLAGRGGYPPPPPPPPPPAMMAPAPMAEDIVVTGSVVTREELGDLQLYRVPEPVTVAAKAQKQVALMDRRDVPVRVIYRTRVDRDPDSVVRLLRARNREADGLGLPLPAGPVALFQPGAGTRLLLGEGQVDDKAVGEEVEIEFGPASAVTARHEEARSDPDRVRHTLTVRNARATAIAYEARFDRRDEDRRERFSARLRPRDGGQLWATTIPAGGTATLRWFERDE